MKEGWRMVKLGEVADFVRGPFGGSLTKSIFKENGYAVYEQQHAIYHHTNIRYFIDQIKFDEMQRFKVKPGDLIMSCSGTIGEVYIIPSNAPVGVINQALLKLSVTSKLDRNYFKNWLESPIFKDIIFKFSKGAAIPNVPGVKILKEIEIPLPPIEEQHRIVSILDASFEKIDALKKNAEENLKNAKALFQQVLAQELKPKEGWVEKKMGEVCDCITDFVAAGSFADLRKNVVYKEESDYAQLVRTTDLKNDFKNKSFVFINEEAFKYLWRVNLNKESIILPNVGVNCGEIYYVEPKDLPYPNNVLGPNAVLVRSNCENNKFLSYYFKGNAFQKLLNDITSTMAQPKFNKTNLKQLLVSFPTNIEEQHRIVLTLDTLSEKCRRLEQVAQQTIRECDALKQSILRQAFSGEL